MTVDERKQRVLQAIVSLYWLDGEPVGSGVLASYLDMAVSSATLRNEMAALAKLGLLEQPHTSAGRVPSAKGYRYYLDHLLDRSQPLDPQAASQISATFASLDGLFTYAPAALDQVDADGDPLTTEKAFNTASLTGDFYYLYVKLEPNIELYKHFIDYLWADMPFYLAYEVRVMLSVTPTAN